MPERHARLSSSTKTYLITGDAVIGSDRSCQVVIPVPRVAAQHARLFFDVKRDGYFLEDLAGARSTKVDGEAITQPVRLGNPCSVTLADVELVFQVVESPEIAPHLAVEPDPLTTEVLPGFDPVTPVLRDARFEPSKQDAAERTKLENPDLRKGFAPLPAPEQAASPQTPTPVSPATLKSSDQTVRMSAAGFLLTIKSPPEVAGVFRLREGQSTVGKAVDCEIRIDSWSMSRKHALLTVEGGRCRLQDLDSTNGTFVGRRRLDAEVVLSAEASVTFGSVEAVLTLNPPG